MTADHDAQTVLDAALLPPSLTETMVSTYLELAEANRVLGLHDLAERCVARAEALAYGGRLALSEVAS